MQATFLDIKLPYLHIINEHTRNLAATYNNNLHSNYILPTDPEFYHVYRIHNTLHPKRDQLKQCLLEHNKYTEIHYPIAPKTHKALQGFLQHYDYPISQRIHQQTVSLPCSIAHN